LKRPRRNSKTFIKPILGLNFDRLLSYAVLSDENKRFMYDIGVYDSDDDDNGMGDFLNEMVVMMNETKPNENGGETFEELQQLFDDMFPGCEYSNSYCGSSSSSSSSPASFSYTQNANSISSQNSSIGNAHTSSGFSTHFQNFCVGVEPRRGTIEGRRGVARGEVRGGRRNDRQSCFRKSERA